MTTYTFNPNSTMQFVNWSDPSVWVGGVVPNDPSGDVVISTGGPYGLFLTETETYTINSLAISHNDLLLDGNLTVTHDFNISAGEIDLGFDGSAAGGSLSVGSLDNQGDIQRHGRIDCSGLFLNEMDVVGSGLILTTVSLTNTGSLVAASGDLTVTVSPGGFTNLSGSTLTGGSYHAGVNQGTSTLFLNVGGVIATDAANISLDGGGAIDSFDGGSGTYVSITSSLHLIAASGTLSLADQTFNWGNLTVDGSIALLRNANLVSTQLTVDTQGTVSGTGVVNAPVLNSGNIVAGLLSLPFPGNNESNLLKITGVVSGSGTLTIASALRNDPNPLIVSYIPATLELGAAASSNVVFQGSRGVLLLDNASSYSGTIAPTGSGDQIVLTGVSLSSVTGYSYSGDSSGGTLTLQESGTAIALKFSGSFETGNFGLSAGPQALSTSPPSLAITITTAPVLRLIGVGDFDANGRSDVAWASNRGGQATMWMNSNGTLAQDAVPLAAMGTGTWTAYGVGDFNGDGKSDLLWTSNTGQVAVWEMNGPNLVGFGVPAGQMGAGTWHVTAIGDFNGDGKSDLLWVNDNGGNAAIWTMNGTVMSGFSLSNGAMGSDWSVLGTGDFNHDGRADVLWENSAGTVDIWEMNGPNLSGFDANVGTAPGHFAGVGHFSGSSGATSDIVWVDDTNHVTIWEMSGGHTNTVSLNGLDGTNWHLQGVGNFAGDAKSDLLWINSNNGAVNIWEVNGSSVTEIPVNAPTGSVLGLRAVAQTQSAAAPAMSDPSQLAGKLGDTSTTAHILIGG
jgi:FG-GAP-like repeat